LAAWQVSEGTIPKLTGFGWSKRADYLLSGLAAAVLAVLLIVWHQSTMTAVIPYNDGSHHVAAVSNLAGAVRVDGPRALLSYASRDPSQVLAYSFFALASLIVGNGRLAFGVGWVVCVGAILLAIWYVFRKAERGFVRSLAFSAVVSLGLFQSISGGAWDTRIDLLSITLSFLTLVAIIESKVFGTLVAFLAASFAKGAAVSLVGPVIVAGFVAGYLRPNMRRVRPVAVAQAVVLGVLAYVFFTRIAPQAASYNLMATGGSTAQDRLHLFFGNLTTYLFRNWKFYEFELRTTYHAWPMFLAPLALVAGIILRWPSGLLRLGAFGLLSLTYTYVLMTASPLHAYVLTVWFFPSMAILALFVVKSLDRYSPIWLEAGLALVLFAAGLVGLPLHAQRPSGAGAVAVNDMFDVSRQMAARLDQRFAGQHQRAIVLVNFLWSDGPIHSNYDAYRVLMQESLQRSDVVLDGWEIGTFGGNWGQELKTFSSYSDILLVLQQHPPTALIDNNPNRNGSSVWDAIGKFRTEHPDCLSQLARPIDMPNGGPQEELMLADDPGCRAAFFELGPAAPAA
jgi:hypothetical protein